MLDPGADSSRPPDAAQVPDGARVPDAPQVPDALAPDCCAVDARIADQFDKRLAELTVDGELPEMVDVSEMLLDLLSDVGSAAPTLLELGSGSGALTVELVRRGAVSADAVDLSPEMVDAGRRRAAEADISDRVTFETGDASLMDLSAHDWVVLDRVFCCYPDAGRLLAKATRAATRRVAFTLPNSRGWRGVANRLMWWSGNIPVVLGRSGCRGYVHSIDTLERRLAQAGFSRRASDHLGLWYAAVWDRREA
jgi:ubiquinone/menaquinone biosynthesis C-methylase UbiE